MEGALRGEERFDRSKAFMVRDHVNPEKVAEDAREERLRKVSSVGIAPRNESLSVPPVIVKGENVYAQLQGREKYLRTQLEKTLDQKSADAALNNIKGLEAERWINMNKDELKALAQQYAQLDQLSGGDAMAAK